jgi:Fe-S cluster biogenesis protein NfuA
MDHGELRKKIEEALDSVRPYLMSDGGDCEVVSISDDGKSIDIRLLGACGSCPSSLMTLKMGIERAIKEAVPSVETINAVRDEEQNYQLFGVPDLVAKQDDGAPS